MAGNIIFVLGAMIAVVFTQGCASLAELLNPVQSTIFIDAIKIENASLSGVTALPV